MPISSLSLNFSLSMLLCYFILLTDGIYNFLCRKKRLYKELFSKSFVCKMADSEGRALTSDVISGNMIFEPILEDGVFRFDCSSSDRDAAFPSISFVNGKIRDIPVMIHKDPSYIPSFQCPLGQQIVKLEVS